MTTFPDFKPSFPKWARNYSNPLVTSLDEDGLELLDMLLIYDPAGRISAKQAAQHAYFTGGVQAQAGAGAGALGFQQGRFNGYH